MIFELLKHTISFAEMGKMDFIKVQNGRLKHDMECQKREFERHLTFLEKYQAEKDLEQKNMMDKEKKVTIVFFIFLIKG